METLFIFLLQIASLSALFAVLAAVSDWIARWMP